MSRRSVNKKQPRWYHEFSNEARPCVINNSLSHADELLFFIQIYDQ
jgi:hypothetical protein